MKIIDLLNQEKVSISCELFPPKYGDKLEEVKSIVSDTAKYNPSFISVTYGAGGTQNNHTVDIVNEVQNQNNIPALAHLTCISSDKEQIRKTLAELKSCNIKNILALRGDIPAEMDHSNITYHHANELIEEIAACGDFCIGAACYPEGHPESPSLQQDIDSLKIKVESGCQFLTTQMFFDNSVLYNYLYKLLKANIDVPVVAGIMPVINAKQISRICKLSGAVLPPRFKAIIDKFAHNPRAMKQAGIAYATEQIIDLIANGVTNIHIYTMNKPDIAGSILHNLSEVIL